jgi:hypothetical protein
LLSFVVMNHSTVNALAPLEFILRIATGLILLLLIVQVLIAFNGGSAAGTDHIVCVDAPIQAMTSTDGKHLTKVQAFGSGDMLKPGMDATATMVRLCDSSPSARQQVWAALSRWSPLAYALGFLFGAWRVTRTAHRRGLFSPDTALGTLQMGLYVLLGALAMWLLKMWADQQLMLSMAHTQSGSSISACFYFFFHMSWAVLFAGFGLLTVGRVMAQSVAMQREIDATV